VISGIPSKLTQLLLLTDLRAESRPAVEFAIELTRHFTARLTLMHGEPLQSGSTFGREDLPTSLHSDPARLALLCLMWEVRQQGVDVGLSTEAGHAPEQIWRTAAARNVDLIVLPFRLVPSSCESERYL
jgi:nucleotide-binding universal stress UspA family protein